MNQGKGTRSRRVWKGPVLLALALLAVGAYLLLWENSPKVAGRSLECLVVESDLQEAGSVRQVKTWYCSALPMGILKEERADGGSSLVDFGADGSSRPPLPK